MARGRWEAASAGAGSLRTVTPGTPARAARISASRSGPIWRQTTVATPLPPDTTSTGSPRSAPRPCRLTRAATSALAAGGRSGSGSGSGLGVRATEGGGMGAAGSAAGAALSAGRTASCWFQKRGAKWLAKASARPTLASARTPVASRPAGAAAGNPSNRRTLTTMLGPASSRSMASSLWRTYNLMAVLLHPQFQRSTEPFCYAQQTYRAAASPTPNEFSCLPWKNAILLLPLPTIGTGGLPAIGTGCSRAKMAIGLRPSKETAWKCMIHQGDPASGRIFCVAGRHAIRQRGHLQFRQFSDGRGKQKSYCRVQCNEGNQTL